MEDFISKKQKIVEIFTFYISQEISQDDFIQQISNIVKDNEIMQIDLFKSILNEVIEFGHELSLKEIKQRKLMIESYIH